MNLSDIWNSIFGSLLPVAKDAETVVQDGNVDKVITDADKVVSDGETVAKDGTTLVVDGESDIKGKPDGGNVIQDAEKVIDDGKQTASDVETVVEDTKPTTFRDVSLY